MALSLFGTTQQPFGISRQPTRVAPNSWDTLLNTAKTWTYNTRPALGNNPWPGAGSLDNAWFRWGPVAGLGGPAGFFDQISQQTRDALWEIHNKLPASVQAQILNPDAANITQWKNRPFNYSNISMNPAGLAENITATYMNQAPLIQNRGGQTWAPPTSQEYKDWVAQQGQNQISTALGYKAFSDKPSFLKKWGAPLALGLGALFLPELGGVLGSLGEGATQVGLGLPLAAEAGAGLGSVTGLIDAATLAGAGTSAGELGGLFSNFGQNLTNIPSNLTSGISNLLGIGGNGSGLTFDSALKSALDAGFTGEQANAIATQAIVEAGVPLSSFGGAAATTGGALSMATQQGLLGQIGKALGLPQGAQDVLNNPLLGNLFGLGTSFFQNKQIQDALKEAGLLNLAAGQQSSAAQERIFQQLLASQKAQSADIKAQQQGIFNQSTAPFDQIARDIYQKMTQLSEPGRQAGIADFMSDLVNKGRFGLFTETAQGPQNPFVRQKTEQLSQEQIARELQALQFARNMLEIERGQRLQGVGIQAGVPVTVPQPSISQGLLQGGQSFANLNLQRSLAGANFFGNLIDQLFPQFRQPIRTT